jgi:hypothetical protein
MVEYQTFALKYGEEEVGLVSKNSKNQLLLSLKGFGNPLIGKENYMPIVNVDDIVGMVMDGCVFVFECENHFIVQFGPTTNAGLYHRLTVYYKDLTAPVFKTIFTQDVNVTGKTVIGFSD